MFLRTWQLVLQFGSGVRILDHGSGCALNSHGDRAYRIRLYGTGVTTANDWALLGGEGQPTIPIAREGDPTPEAGAGTYIASVSVPTINDLHQVFYRVTFAGPGIDDSNRYGDYFGPYGESQLILRHGQRARYFPENTLLDVSPIDGSLAMDDVGDFAAVTRVQNWLVGTVEVLGVWSGLTRQYIPLLETGTQVLGRTVTLADCYSLYMTKTGGSDGLPQSFNDSCQLATLLDFTDGTSGVYRIGPPMLGDTDGDGQVGPPELLAFAGCTAGPGGSVGPGCEALDLNLDATIDLEDFALLQPMVGEQR
jgi:hypothetical protein